MKDKNKATVFKVKETENKLLISYYGDKVVGLNFVLVPAVILFGMIYMLTIVNNTRLETALAYLFFPGTISFISIYIGLTIIVNVKKILITDKIVTVKSSPMPVFNNRKLKLNTVKKFYYEDDMFYTKYGEQHVYKYIAIGLNNKKIVLFESGEFEDIDFLLKKINTWMKDNNIKILGELN